MLKSLTAVAVTALLIHGFALPVAAESKTATIGRAVESFELKDYRGKKHSLSDFKDRRAVVVAFLGTECPLVKLYGPRLQQLADRFGDDVAFIGVNSNRHDSITEIAAFARRHQVGFPILKDVGNKLADAIGATRTPEVFLLDDKQTIRYYGRIDDQYGVGYAKEKPHSTELADAIEQVLKGKPVTVDFEQAVGCIIGRTKEASTNSAVTYSNQISRILQKRCVECHRSGEIAPFELTDYSEVAGWAEMIREVVKEKRMPPWHADPKHGQFTNDRTLSDEERQLIFDWVEAGAPEGDPSMLPTPVSYTLGWQLARNPDAVVKMRSKPFMVPAEGTVRYQYFTVDPGFTEDKWVQAAEIIPGNRAVVHHVLVFARGAGNKKGEVAGGGSFLAGYVPGQRSHALPKGMAKLVPAGSKLVFQVHYTPIGTPQEDLSSIGFLFADPDEIDHVVMTRETVNHSFRIPPQHDNYKVEAYSQAAPTDVKLLGLMPHMHVRGKSFRYEVIPPKGDKTTILDVPNYDFNWQTSYRLKEPLALTANTKIHCVAHFDNSENNLNNPDSSKTVRWGDQTWNEMMIGYIDIAIPRKAVEENKMSTAAAQKVMDRFDKNGDGKITRKEISRRLSRVFDRLDKNKDDIVTLEELRLLER